MAKMLSLFVLLAFGTCFNIVEPSQSPNIQLSLTDKGLNYVSKVLVNNLVKQVKGLAVPPISLYGLQLKSAKVTSVRLTSASFSVNNGLLKLSLNMEQITIYGWYLSGSWFSRWETFRADLKGLIINQYLSIGHNIKGQPTAGNAGCTTTIQDSSYKFGNSFFLNILANMARRAFEPTVGKKICDAVGQAIEKKGKILPTLYPEHHKANGLNCTTISYPIKHQPIVEEDYIDFLITGDVKSRCNPLNISSSGRQRMTRFVPTPGKMLSIAFADDFMNLLLKHHYKAGALATHSRKIHFTSPPVVMTTRNGSTITFNGTGNVRFESNLLIQIRSKKLSLKLTNSRVHPTTVLKGSRDIKAKKSNALKIQRILNASLRHVIPLPLIDAMRLVNDQVIYDEGRVILQMDIRV